MTEIVRETDDGVVLSAPLPYLTVEAVLQCLAIAKAETLRDKMRPYLLKAGVADPQEIRIPCGLLYAVRKRIRKWHDADPENVSRYWDATDDAALTAAWRDGLRAHPAT
ncbi:hypothetical protein ABZ608_41000 [Streptomyces sp. NPDC013172]|uniref:hypothetical protein n=1 Tax=Streptomyces sp. NPDC013172 TaxID=3155009 RepID=UPI00340F9639